MTKCVLKEGMKPQYLGGVHDPEFAAKIYDVAATLFHGEFVRTNFTALDPEALDCFADFAHKRIAQDKFSGISQAEFELRYAALVVSAIDAIDDGIEIVEDDVECVA